MGQGSSQPDRAVDAIRENRQSVVPDSMRYWTREDSENLRARHSTARPRPHPRSNSANRLSQLLHPSSRLVGNVSRTSPTVEPAPQSSLRRTATRVRNLLIRSDGPLTPTTSLRPSLPLLQHRTPYVRADMTRDGAGYQPPRLPPIDISATFDGGPFDRSDDPDSLMRTTSGRRAYPAASLNAFRSHRPLRTITSSFRRRRSPQPSLRRAVNEEQGAGEDGATNEDQATMLSRLLSFAAAATAATLIGDDQQAMSEARSLTSNAAMGDLTTGGEDGSFDGFLRALQNGRIASALRQGRENDSDSAIQEGPLNFFRMFRFGPAAGNEPASVNGNRPERRAAGDAPASEGRMVPIIIVGIRSINPSSGAGSGSAADDLPPFIDALGNFPSPMPTAEAFGAPSHDSIDSMLRPPQNGTSFRHRRRASVGGFGMSRSRIHDRLDDQRDHRSPDLRRDRPWSIASSSGMEPRPPPATPASPSPELSRISSRTGTPNHSRPASLIANSLRDLAADSRRNSAIHRASAASPLSSHTEETSSLHSTHSATNLLASIDDIVPSRFSAHRRSDTAPNVHYPRFASGHPRRNGVVEPDNLPPLSRTSTSDGTDTSGTATNTEGRRSNSDNRSWIIYVLGGSYPENHPILTTPSLFTENPTYEDMMLLSALLGPAKAPVASEEDVQNAGGIYTLSFVDRPDVSNVPILVAIAVEGNDRVELEDGQRCLVCLCDFEADETCRRLIKCKHLFHKECIDQWLTQGRNSCPLCRGQGVDEKERPDASTTNGTPSNPAELSAA